MEFIVHRQPTKSTKRSAFAAVALTAGLLVAAPSPAHAAARTTEKATFARAVAACEERVAPNALGACVRELVAPEPGDTAMFDLLYIFNDCLWYTTLWALDEMYPPTEEEYEDAVNECLGL
jgi:hypothetical protein